ncbi:hypothetical protein ACHAXA_009239 [Cyclostephanos tholiformis]|uniref:Peptidase S1 domain-containing protein n=1 Tax=Cyclostephanos tholiformis TaxID=382380 RepID=A0ABD3RBC9_9STRA
MNLSFASIAFYSALDSVRGQETTSLRGHNVEMALAPTMGADEVKNRRMQEQDRADARIIGGSEAVEDRFSYAVSLQYLDKHNCGGSLIARDVVLTAAHCVGGITSAVLGRHNLADGDGEVFSIRRQLPHPEYHATIPENDFMLVFLEGTTTADNFIPVKLNSDPLVPSVGQDMTVMGWGDTDSSGVQDDFFVMSDVLLSIDVGFLSDEECGAIWGVEPSEISDSMMCAKRPNGRGTCQGDSGGPLVIKGDDGAPDLQLGVVSFGSGLGCATDVPDVYARISHAYEWIQSEICMGSVYASEAGFDCSSISTIDSVLDFISGLFDGK